MSNHKADYLAYRLTKANEALSDVKLLMENKRWAACMNRLYYACFYAASAILLNKGISVKTHTGLKAQFNLHLVKTGIMTKEQGKLYAIVMDWREKGDYGDMFDIEADTILPLLKPVENFVRQIEDLLK